MVSVICSALRSIDSVRCFGFCHHRIFGADWLLFGVIIHSVSPTSVFIIVSEPIDMYAVVDVYFLLFRRESILFRITHCQQTGELIAFGSIDNLLYLLRLVSHGNMEHSSKTFISCGEQHIFHRTPCRGEVVERALFHRLKQRALFLVISR